MVVANSKCLQDRLVAINRQAQNSQKWPRLHRRLHPRKHRLRVVVHHLEDPLALEDHLEIIHPNILQWGHHHT